MKPDISYKKKTEKFTSIRRLNNMLPNGPSMGSEKKSKEKF